MTSRHDPQLLKGVLSLLLLRLLAERESYGYEVVQRLHELGLPDVLEGTVYPALARLERDGSLTTRLVASNSGPARKYYRLTAVGAAALDEAVANWISLVGIVDAAMSRPADDQPAPFHPAPFQPAPFHPAPFHPVPFRPTPGQPGATRGA